MVRVGERVYTMTEVDEIPREGIADFEGRPHFYVCEWNDGADRYASTFELSPVGPEVLALALEDWAIWQRWWAAFEDGRVAEDSGPALPEDEARHRELAASLDERLRLEPEHCVRAFGEFRPQTAWSGAGIAPHEVRWERCPPRDPLDDRYAGFWQRFAAHWIDVLVLLPLGLAVIKLDAISRTTAIAIAVPVAALNLAYTIVGHGRFGKTVGKWAMRIRVARTSGEPIGWRQAGCAARSTWLSRWCGLPASCWPCWR
jgi:hypothetical protein